MGQVFRRNHLVRSAESIKDKTIYFYFSKERQISIVMFILKILSSTAFFPTWNQNEIFLWPSQAHHKAGVLEGKLKELKESIEQKKNTNTLNMKEMSTIIARLTDVCNLLLFFCLTDIRMTFKILHTVNDQIDVSPLNQFYHQGYKKNQVNGGAYLTICSIEPDSTITRWIGNWFWLQDIS